MTVINLITIVVQEKTYFNDQNSRKSTISSDTNFFTTQTQRHMTDIREWESMKLPKPVVSLKKIFTIKLNQFNISNENSAKFLMYREQTKT